MQPRLISTISTVGITLLATACASTRVVKTQPGKGGEIAVHEGLIGNARADAKEKMAANCGSKHVEVVEEGEAVVGSRTYTNTDNTKRGSTSSADSDDKREWRLKYKCVGKKGKGKSKDAE